MAVNLNPSRRHAEVGFAALLLGAAVWAYVEAGNYAGQSGGYPRVLAILLGLSAIILAARTLMGASAPDDARLFDHPGRFVVGLGMIFLYVVAIDVVGYILPSLIFGIGVPMLLGYRHLQLLLPVVIGILVFIYLVFKVMLERPLPPDVLDGVLRAIL
ncbi:hypothetical protein GCM10007276_07130 [Agaricicola taiwanensis]|uniref:DUF1468 domain-containing protein n=1 Tax=Agaricicola taiwanensis TaxID=591372 RepID=A0A8J2VM19_9RHOB|nr:tripartite tricarboxylate transporter TctB family protein [Agaricicola taiwanensis]GGE32427.1 hypothetical protein GCM10007276_07130 [Agaricicola taiwanensis]